MEKEGKKNFLSTRRDKKIKTKSSSCTSSGIQDKIFFCRNTFCFLDKELSVIRGYFIFTSVIYELSFLQNDNVGNRPG
jgi:hypothetical protein